MRSHLKLYFDFEKKTEELSDEEKGRLLLTMLRYAKDGTVGGLTGNEKILFPVFKMQIDEEINTYETKVSNGSRGGRPTKNEEPEESNENQTKPEETENNQTEPNETENNQEEPNKTEIAKKEERRKKKEEQENSIRRFTPPTIEQVREYCRERNNDVPPEKWFNYYTANGWKVGKNPMKDWKAAVRTWEKGDNSNAGHGSTSGQTEGKVRSAYSWLDERDGV